MSRFDSTPIYLRAWLFHATKGIASWDRERIIREICAHCDDAVTEGLAQGLSQDDAERVALESLGSARKARRENKKTCSSVYAEKVVTTMVERHEKRRRAIEVANPLFPLFTEQRFPWGYEHFWALCILTPLTIIFLEEAINYPNQFVIPAALMVALLLLAWYLTFVAIPNAVKQNRLKEALIHRGAFEAVFYLPLALILMDDFPRGLFVGSVMIVGGLSQYYFWYKEAEKLPSQFSRDDLLKG